MNNAHRNTIWTAELFFTVDGLILGEEGSVREMPEAIVFYKLINIWNASKFFNCWQ